LRLPEYQIRHLQVAQVQQQGHLIAEQGEVDQVIAAECLLVGREIDQDVAGVQVAMLQADSGIEWAGRAPPIRLERIGQRIGKDVALDQKSAQARRHIEDRVEELFNLV